MSEKYKNTKREKMETLPTDVLLIILAHVPAPGNFCASSKQLAQLARTERHYGARFENEYRQVTKADHLSYQQIYQMCRRFEAGQARLINVPDQIYPEWCEEDCDISTENMELLNEKVLPYVREQGAKRGDVIHLGPEPDYRNDGKYLYDGQQIVQLDYDRDEYGAIAPQFQILDDHLSFSPSYWLETIAHNRLVYWDAQAYLDQLVQNIQPRQKVRHKIGKHHYTTSLVTTSFIHRTGMPFVIQFAIDEKYTRRALIKCLKRGVFEVSDEDWENPYLLKFFFGGWIRLYR